MRLIDAGQIVYSWFVKEDGTMSDGITLQSIINRLPTIVEFEGDINKVIIKGEEYHKQLTTTWFNPYCPYTCQHCGHYSDSKTPFCAYCGRKAINYENRTD